ncbi:UNVERIFIED_CONTAM: hypothetical protein NCL1_38969 [Trichonephila clavipes]
MENEKEHARHCLLYEFNKKSTATAACHNVCQVYEEDEINKSTCCRWFPAYDSQLDNKTTAPVEEGPSNKPQIHYRTIRYECAVPYKMVKVVTNDQSDRRTINDRPELPAYDSPIRKNCLRNSYKSSATSSSFVTYPSSLPVKLKPVPTGLSTYMTWYSLAHVYLVYLKDILAELDKRHGDELIIGRISANS